MSFVSLRMPFGLLLTLGSLSACGAQNSSANQEFVRLSQFISAAVQTKDPLERNTRLSSAVKAVDDLLREYPSSNAAVRIAANEKIGPLNRIELQAASAEASFDSTVCKKNVTVKCLLGNVTLRFNSYNDYGKKALALSYKVAALRSEDRETLRKFEYYASNSWAPSSAPNKKFGYSKIVGLYLADQLSNDPSKFWVKASAFANDLPDPAFIQAYEIALACRFSQASDFVFFNNANKAIEGAPEQFRDRLRESLDRKRLDLISRMGAKEVVENIGKIKPQEVIQNYFTDAGSLAPEDQNKLINFVPPEKLGDIIRSAHQVDQVTMERNIKRSQSNVSQGETFLKEYMLRFPYALPLNRFLVEASSVDKSSKCEVLLKRYLLDLKAHRNDAEILARAYDCNRVLSDLLLMIVRDGFSDGTVKAIREALIRKDIRVDTAPLLALSSVAGTAFPVKQVLKWDFDWIDDPSTFHASASLFLSALARHLNKKTEYPFSDDDASFFVDSLTKSKFLPRYAYYVWVLKDRGLLDVSQKLDERVRKTKMSDVETEELNTPNVKKMIYDEKIDDAVMLFFSLPSEVRIRMLGKLAADVSNQKFDKFFSAVGSRDLALIGQMVYRSMINGWQSDENKRLIIIKYGSLIAKYKDINPTYVIDPYMNAIWRSRDVEGSSRVYFDRVHPFIDAAALYVLLDQTKIQVKR